MSNIDNELAFGSYVSIPIRTEKTAEQKWIELRNILTTRQLRLEEVWRMAKISGDEDMAVRAEGRHCEVENVLSDMDELDT
mgnify:CR=1 FL=1